jgi:hypothetical protein
MRGKFTVRIMLSAMLTALLATSLAWVSLPHAATAADTTSVSLAASSQTVPLGAQFTASVVVTPAAAIAGGQFDMTFDPSLVAVTRVEEGNLFSQSGASTFFSQGAIDNQAGTISGAFGAIISPGRTVSTQGTFATITLVAKTQRANCSLCLENVVVGDVNGLSVPVTVVGTTITIGDNPPVLSPIGNKAVTEGSLLSFTVSASDPDGDTLTYTVSNLPSGATFQPATRTFSWTPGDIQSGTYTSVHFQVGDGLMIDSEDITITVSDRATTAPSVPSLLSPANGAVTTDHTPYLDWSTVTSNSSVRYTVQVDNNADFSSPVVNKTRLSGSSYTLTKKLAHGTYYWRVRAMDADGDTSAWTANRSVTVA